MSFSSGVQCRLVFDLGEVARKPARSITWEVSLWPIRHDKSELSEEELASLLGGKRHLSDLGGRGLLEIGMYVTKDLETQKVSEGATIWEGLVVNVPATVFQEEDPDGYYMGNVRDAPCLVQASLACANAPCLCLACGR